MFTRFTDPFVYHHGEVKVCAPMQALFSSELNWVRHNSFYQCDMADVTSLISNTTKATLLQLMEHLHRCPLLPQVFVTAQRMREGDQATIHTDEPSLGFETHRLVLHLDDRSPQEGGQLLLQKQTGEVVRALTPKKGQAFVFELTEQAFHTVTPCSTARHALVFNFWHPANSEQVAKGITSLFEQMHFGAIPQAANPFLERWEAELPEEEAYERSMAAYCLLKAGFSEDDLREALANPSSDLKLACWAARLKNRPFSLEAFEAAKEEIGEVSPRLFELKKVLFSSSWPEPALTAPDFVSIEASQRP